MSKIKNNGLDQYSTEPFEQQQFGTASVELINIHTLVQVRWGDDGQFLWIAKFTEEWMHWCFTQ